MERPSDYPQKPDPNTPVDQIVFLNFMKMIHRGDIEVEEANRQLDLLDFDPKVRFWGSHKTYNDGRVSIHSIKWENGKWTNGSRDHQEQVRKIRTGEA